MFQEFVSNKDKDVFCYLRYLTQMILTTFAHGHKMEKESIHRNKVLRFDVFNDEPCPSSLSFFRLFLYRIKTSAGLELESLEQKTSTLTTWSPPPPRPTAFLLLAIFKTFFICADLFWGSKFLQDTYRIATIWSNSFESRLKNPVRSFK